MKKDDEVIFGEITRGDLLTARDACLAKASRVRARVVAIGASLPERPRPGELKRAHDVIARYELKATALDTTARRLDNIIIGGMFTPPQTDLTTEERETISALRNGTARVVVTTRNTG